jgi:hypothetical protein
MGTAPAVTGNPTSNAMANPVNDDPRLMAPLLGLLLVGQ